MCIVARQVHLSNTQIFTCVCGITDNKPARQLVMYQNKVTFTNPEVNDNIMCLPIPLQDGLDPKENVVLYDFSYEGKSNARLKAAYKDFFRNADSCFKPQSKNKSKARKKSKADGDEENFLEVVQVGGYQCSLARTPADVLNLDPAVFGKPVGLQSVLEKNYENNFAFLLCRFSRQKEGNTLDLHPIVYTFPIPSSGNLFIPTKHYHGSGEPNEEWVDDWDHGIYILGADHTKIAKTISNSKFKGGKKPIPASREEFNEECQRALNDLLKDSSKDSFPVESVYHNECACKVHVKGKFDNVDFQPPASVIVTKHDNKKQRTAKQEVSGKEKPDN